MSNVIPFPLERAIETADLIEMVSKAIHTLCNRPAHEIASEVFEVDGGAADYSGHEVLEILAQALRKKARSVQSAVQKGGAA
jgi:hypothetical protein